MVLATLSDRKKLLQMMYRNIYIERGQIKAVEPTELMWVLLDTVMIRNTGRTRADSNISPLKTPLNFSRVSPFLNALN